MADRAHSDVRETSTTGGTGNQVLAGAFDGSYKTFLAAGYADGDKGFAIFKQGTSRELSEITYNAGANSLSRSVIKSTNSNNLVNFTAGQTIDIFDCLPGPSDLSASQRARLLALFGGISFEAQTLTAAQRAQARSNISAALKGHIHGLTLSRDAGDTSNDIAITAGEAASTETDPVLMVLASALTKQVDVAWAVGTGNGGLDTGSVANTTYHVWLIQRSDTGVVDALFSTSASSPTMPTNYDRKRRIGSIVRAGGTNRAFAQNGDEFTWSSSAGDVTANNPGTSAVTRTLTVPLGIVVDAVVHVGVRNDNNAVFAAALVAPLDAADDVPINGSYATTPAANLDSGRFATVMTRVKTNTSGQINSRLSASDADVTLNIYTRGYIDRRGRDA